jgi:hypothetical protein
MKAIEYIRWADPPLWRAAFSNLLPLWLLSFGYIVGWVGPAFWLAIVAIIILLWVKWFTPELILYSLLPIIILMFLFDEMSPRYEAGFILICTLFLTIGIFGYRISFHKDFLGLGWLILLGVFIGTCALASHANQNYWQLVSNLDYGCPPDIRGCPPLTGNETPWWILFFSP